MVAFTSKPLFALIYLTIILSSVTATALPSSHNEYQRSDSPTTHARSIEHFHRSPRQQFQRRWFSHVTRQSDSADTTDECPPGTDCGSTPPSCPPGTDCSGSTPTGGGSGGCPPGTDCGSTPPSGGSGTCPPGTDCGSGSSGSTGTSGNPPQNECAIDENCFGPVGSDDGN
ncbi:hypothetical protein SISSUDRAFT_1048988 [Sistotremastrum suecicum HHB10207 ss-3]|uniref:Uncharacterized protein n=1 Tax=Sistotremastrum suecicum HHB10207 ss-3 TaxID=1314776 RepID=A0A166C4D8_9AGAM|nr:hypothetical protein SISSUDRAFT_1048988 [Sistotremastrum suecicum HHB10207 ss-3]